MGCGVSKDECIEILAGNDLMTHQESPLCEFPTELVANVIKYFGCFDLLSARLVSRDWNQEIRRYLLKSSGYKIDLTKENSLKNYIDFQNQHESGYILPFHLKFSARSFNFDYANNLDAFATNVDLLVQMIGKDCVHTLQFEFGFLEDQTKCIELLITLLEKLASGLECVQFQCPPRYGNFSTASEVEAGNKLTNHSLTLPNVTELEVQSYTSPGAILCWSLIKKCPRLKKLNLFLGSTENTTPDEISSLPLANVTSLEIYPDSLLLPLVQQVISSQTPLGLNHLTLIKPMDNNTNGMSAEAIQVLSSLSDTLTTLKIIVLRQFHNPTSLPFTAAKIFARLKTLVIEYYDDPREPADLDLVSDPTFFPALNFVEFPHNVNLKTQNAPEFPNVKTLTIYADYLTLLGVRVCPHKKFAAANYLQIFPNLTRVRIIKGVPSPYHGQNQDSNDKGGQIVREVLQGLIQSEVDTSATANAKIQVIELIGCPQNYLGEILLHVQKLTDGQGLQDQGQTVIEELTSPPRVVNHVTNVRKVSFLTIPSSWSKMSKRYRHSAFVGSDQSRNLFSDKPIELYMDVMLKNLPKLEEINISRELLGSDANAKSELVQDFQAQYPTLKLNIV